MKRRELICPHRLRHLERPFGWMPLRLITSGNFGTLSKTAKIVYTFLCIVSDREGMSCYSENRMMLLLQLEESEVIGAKEELVNKALITCEQKWIQVLSLPRKEEHKEASAERSQTKKPLSRKEAQKHIQAIISKLSEGRKYA